ncbi:hypothetical protein [Mycolicibacter algericus]|uniref:Integral membrane protein n=1 Tax=Mycolicibacter algericus DSM 45454 TaxID=723879 RepID=A0ABX3RVN4_MYCAL|nr:hypothetical protein [Mycolicibacter algericus]OQZ98245.1 hypothetical protein BST10_05350 [Mycolicibacter algericus DSM 45454]
MGALIAGLAGYELRHPLVAVTAGWTVLSWPLIFRPLHDAPIEDALDTAATALNSRGPHSSWSIYVRMLRRAAGGRRPP